MRFKIGTLVIVILLSILSTVMVFADSGNLAKNPGFEEGEVNAKDWESAQWDISSGITEFKLDNSIKYSGNKSVCVINNSPNDSRYKQKFKLDPLSYYRVSCRVKTENVGSEGKGANISIDGKLDCSDDIKGTTTDWKLLELYCKTGKKSEQVFFTFGLGGYSSINSGKAWFDDVVVEKISSLPAGVNTADLSSQPAASNTGTSPENSMKTAYHTPLTLFGILFFFAALLLYFNIRGKNLKLTANKERIILWSVIAVGLIIRIFAAVKVEGFTIDMNCFKAWALAAAKDLPHFYNSGMFVDYPPFYIYILFMIGKIAGIPAMAVNLNLLVKLPSILADLATAYLLYRLAKKRLPTVMSLLAAGVYSFNPAVLINSSIWGQVDSFFTLMIVGVIVLIAEERLNLAAALIVAAVLMKPQGIIIAPVLFFELLRRKDVRIFAKAVLTGLGTALLILLPFSFTQEPLWIINLFIKTGKEYPFASLNAYNLFSLFGANTAPVDNPFIGLSYGVWGLIFDLAIAVFVGWLYYKARNTAALPFISALVLNTGAFVLSASMHERYLFPSVALALLAFIYLKDKRLMAVFLAFTLTVFLNTDDVLYRFLSTNNGNIPPNSFQIAFFSMMNLLLLIYLLKISWNIVIKNKLSLEIQTAGNTRVNIPAGKTGKAVATGSTGLVKQGQTRPKFRVDRIDIIIISAMTLLYAIIAFINLGGTKAPNTYWEPAKAGESVTLDLGKQVNVARISWYCGINEARYDSSNKYIVEYLDPNGNYMNLGVLEKRDVYTWKHMDVTAVTNKLRLTVQEPHGTINEIAVFEAGNQVPVRGIQVTDIISDPEDRGKPQYLTDEQNLVQYWASFMTGTYFDEVYHARTAYEYLNKIEPMEWTHPPLGKIIISLGIAIFGMNPFGWRIMGTLFGIAMIPVMYLFGRKIFYKRLYGFVAAFLMMFDFMHFAQTRIATIDVYGTFFIILMYYFMYDYFINKSYNLGFKKSLKPLFLSGLFFGLGAASKWIGLYAGGGLALLFFMVKIREYLDYRKIMKDAKKEKPEWVRIFVSHYISRTMLYCILFFVIIPGIIYILSYIPYMLVPGPGHGIEAIYKNQLAMFNYHSSSVLGATHSFSSKWWSWPFILKPIWFYKGEGMAQGMASSIVSMGNPAIWWAGILVVVGLISAAVVKCTQTARKLTGFIAGSGLILLLMPGEWKWGVVLLFAAAFVAIESMDTRLGVIFAAIAFQYLPWVFVERLAFIYHFFSSVPFLILFIVFAIKWVAEKYETSRKHTIKVYSALAGYLVLVAVLFIVFYPVLSGAVVSQNYIDTWLRWFKDSHNSFLWFTNVNWYF